MTTATPTKPRVSRVVERARYRAAIKALLRRLDELYERGLWDGKAR